MEFLNKKIPARPPFDPLLSGVSPVKDTSRSLVFAAGVFVSICIGALIIYALLFGLILKKKDMITGSISKLDTEQLKEAQLQNLKESFRKTEPERQELLSHFINSEGIVDFIENIEKIGRQAQVGLQFKFVNLREDGLAMEFEALGSFNELFYFLNLLEQMPFRLQFEKIVIHKDIPRTVQQRKKSDTWYAVFTLTLLSFDTR